MNYCNDNQTDANEKMGGLDTSLAWKVTWTTKAVRNTIIALVCLSTIGMALPTTCNKYLITVGLP